MDRMRTVRLNHHNMLIFFSSLSNKHFLKKSITDSSIICNLTSIGCFSATDNCIKQSHLKQHPKCYITQGQKKKIVTRERRGIKIYG
jgi:hypothetical protein